MSDRPSSSSKVSPSGSDAEEAVGSSDTIRAPSEDLTGADPSGETGDTPAPRGRSAVRDGRTSTDDLVGKSLADRYTVLEQIGKGGMSIVYLARHELLKKQVAIKVLKEDLTTNKESLMRFHREAMAAASIGDPHIVDITDYGFTEKGDSFIAMEHLEGQDLRALITSDGALEINRSLLVARQILQALDAAHGSGIIHRDLKSENVFLVQREGADFVKLLDFGISKILEPQGGEDKDAGLTSTGQVLGTPQYLAPEQAHGIENVDHRADIYALGVIFYEMLTGELPFSGKSVFEVVMKHVQEPPEPPRKRRPDLAIPPAVEAVVLRALSKDPDDRYQTAKEMLDALPGTGTTGDLLGSQPLATVSKPGRGALGYLAIVVAICAVGVFVFLQLGDSPGKSNGTAVADLGGAVAAPTPDARRSPPDLGNDLPSRALADAAVKQVTVKIKTLPRSARIYIGQRLLGRGVATLDVPRSNKVLLLRAVARQHRTTTYRVTPERNQTVTIKLKRLASTGSTPLDLQRNPYKKNR